MTAANFIVGAERIEGLGVGASLRLDGDEGRHASRVQRIAVGETILVSDGAARQLTCDVSGRDQDGLDLVVTAIFEAPERLPRLTLVQALAKAGRDEQAVESATELGVDAVVPWQADRSIVRWHADRAAKGRARWESVARTAVKQCRRATMPVVSNLVTSTELAKDIAALTGATSRRRDALESDDPDSSADELATVVLVLHETADLKLAEALRADAAATAASVILVAGPEGGISPVELDALEAAGARPVLLGPEVLRTSTAGPAALAVVSQLVGRWD